MLRMLRMGGMNRSFRNFVICFMFTSIIASTLLASLFMATIGPSVIVRLSDFTSNFSSRPPVPVGYVSITRGSCPCFDQSDIRALMTYLQEESKSKYAQSPPTSWCNGALAQGNNDNKSNSQSQSQLQSSSSSRKTRNTLGMYEYSSEESKGFYCRRSEYITPVFFSNDIHYVDCKILIDDACDRLKTQWNK